MSVAVQVAAEGVRLAVARARVVAAAEHVLRAERVRNAMVSLTFVTRRRIAALNRSHLGRAGDTDVIAFGFSRPTPRDPVIGDVYIAPEVVRRNALANARPVREELLRVVVHGVLHVLGHDHPEGDDRLRSAMWKRQERLLRAVLAAAAR